MVFAQTQYFIMTSCLTKSVAIHTQAICTVFLNLNKLFLTVYCSVITIEKKYSFRLLCRGLNIKLNIIQQLITQVVK